MLVLLYKRARGSLTLFSSSVRSRLLILMSSKINPFFWSDGLRLHNLVVYCRSIAQKTYSSHGPVEITFSWWTRVFLDLIFDELYSSGEFQCSVLRETHLTTHIGTQCLKSQQWARFACILHFLWLMLICDISDYECVSHHPLINEVFLICQDTGLQRWD